MQAARLERVRIVDGELAGVLRGFDHAKVDVHLRDLIGTGREVVAVAGLQARAAGADGRAFVGWRRAASRVAGGHSAHRHHAGAACGRTCHSCHSAAPADDHRRWRIARRAGRPTPSLCVRRAATAAAVRDSRSSCFPHYCRRSGCRRRPCAHPRSGTARHPRNMHSNHDQSTCCNDQNTAIDSAMFHLTPP